jgi:drug/metabolite transporter (DMT)-like permease
VAALLALASAACYGLADFIGGLLSRRAHFGTVALIGQLSGFLLSLVVLPLLPGPGVTAAGLGWGALSGVGTGIGMLFLYRGLGRGAMSVVVPVSAVGGVALPVLVGVALLGDRPSVLSWSGIVIAVPALWLVSRPRATGGSTSPGAALDGLIAGAGIALQYIALAQAGPGTGLWPIVAGRLAAGLVVLAVVRSRTGRPAAGAGRAEPVSARVRAAHRNDHAQPNDPRSHPTHRDNHVQPNDPQSQPTHLNHHAQPDDLRSQPTQRNDRARLTSGLTWGAVAAGGTATLALLLYLLATRQQLVVVAVVLSSLYPAIPVLLGITALHERLSRSQAVGLLAAAAAVGLLVGHG